MCIKTLDGAKLMQPDNLSTLDTHNNLIHVTFNSAIFGFLDDMLEMTTHPFYREVALLTRNFLRAEHEELAPSETETDEKA